MRKNTIGLVLLLFLLTTACKDKTSDHEIDGTLLPTIGISAGLDPDLSFGDVFGGLAGTSIDLPFSSTLYDYAPESLPILQSDQDCKFLGGGIELGLNGLSTFTAQNSTEGLQAKAVSTFQSYDDNTRITIDFALSANAVPVQEGTYSSAMAGTSGADRFGVLSDGVFLVIDIDNINGLDTEVHVEWRVDGELSGNRNEAQWDVLAMHSQLRECDGLSSIPAPLIDLIEDDGSDSGSRTITMGDQIHSQIILRLDAGIITNAWGGTGNGDPPTQSSGKVEGVLEFIVKAAGL